MEFVSVRELRIHAAQVWKRLSAAGELIITSNGRPIALLSGVTPATLEATLTALRRARAQVAVSVLRDAAQARGYETTAADEIEAEVAASRKARARS
jgi:antitoxin (DNA-binding transcriptional repressor) of toxin-antitoxin stability system